MGSTLSKNTAITAIIYSAGPFFSYPWKIIMNMMYGGAYLESYRHFRAQHMVGYDLFYHVLCLVWQLSSNYALLGSLDDAMERKGWFKPRTELLKTLNSLLWSWHLVRTSPTPLSVKVASVISIYVAHTYAGDFFQRHWKKVVFLQGFLEAAAVQALRERITIGPYLAYLVARTALWKYLNDNHAGSLKKYNTPITAGLFALMAFNSTIGIGSVVSMGIYGWILSILTGNRDIYFWSCGMTATLGQAVAHNLSREPGTLVVLQKQMDMVKYELSHVTYFPNLLFQAIHAHFGL